MPLLSILTATAVAFASPPMPDRRHADVVYLTDEAGRGPRAVLRLEVLEDGGINGLSAALLVLDAANRVLFSQSLEQVEGAKLYQEQIHPRLSRAAVVVATYSRADGVELEVLGATLLNGKPVPLFPESISTDSANLLCVGDLDGSASVKAALVEWDVNDEACTMCWPKIFKMRLFAWSASGFVPESTATTKHRYRSARDALPELAVRCPSDLLRLN